MDHDVLVEWDEKYSIGIPLIDDQHKKLIEMTNTLYRGCLGGPETADAYFKEAIQGTVDYVKYHFAMEEKLLEQVQYPGLAEHKKQHQGFIRKILEDVQNFQQGKKFVPNTFVRFLKDWILSHIALMDTQYAAYILKNRREKKAIDHLK
jgi:hemerythrin